MLPKDVSPRDISLGSVSIRGLLSPGFSSAVYLVNCQLQCLCRPFIIELRPSNFSYCSLKCILCCGEVCSSASNSDQPLATLCFCNRLLSPNILSFSRTQLQPPKCRPSLVLRLHMHVHVPMHIYRCLCLSFLMALPA